MILWMDWRSKVIIVVECVARHTNNYTIKYEQTLLFREVAGNIINFTRAITRRKKDEKNERRTNIV